MKQIIVIGGGPSGMMAAISSKKHHPDAHVILVDRNKRLGTKLRLTGGGRCNVTADVSNETVIEYVPKNGKFLYSALSEFDTKSIQVFFEEAGCPLKIEDHHRVFPVSNKSHDIVDALERTMITMDIEIVMETNVIEIQMEPNRVITETGTLAFDALIIATGGKTLPGTGSDGTGLKLAESLGHTITDLVPAEVPLVSNDRVIQEKTLQGLSFKDVIVSIYVKNKVKKRITHDLLFTHFGISGPAALRASYYVLNAFSKERPIKLMIDFLPVVTFEELRAITDSAELSQTYGLPKRLIDFLKHETETLQEMLHRVKNFPLTVYDTRGFAHAFVTNGGVSIREINPKTLKSKINTSLSFCGEVMDVNAFTGGFNITTALTTGYSAGKYAL